MKIALYVESEAYRWMADAAIASARRFMPNAEIVHLTNTQFPALDGADMVVRDDLPGRNFLGRYFGLAHHLHGDVLYANCDILFKASVERVFEAKFDLAVPHIASPTVNYDGAIFFSRSPSFFEALSAAPECFGPEAPVGAQLAAINDTIAAFRGRVRALPGCVYSYVPKGPNDDCTGASIVHYRGPRKEWMAADSAKDKTAYRRGRELTHPGLKV